MGKKRVCVYKHTMIPVLDENEVYFLMQFYFCFFADVAYRCLPRNVFSSDQEAILKQHLFVYLI